MIILATPDFGAGASIACFVLIVWAIVLAGVGLGIHRGTKLCQAESPKVRRAGVFLVVVCGLIPFVCWLGPPYAIRVAYGNYPIGVYANNVEEGMSADEVTAFLGTPHNRITQGDGERWYYWIDSFGINWCCVRFGPDGRVEGKHGN